MQINLGCVFACYGLLGTCLGSPCAPFPKRIRGMDSTSWSAVPFAFARLRNLAVSQLPGILPLHHRWHQATFPLPAHFQADLRRWICLPASALHPWLLSTPAGEAGQSWPWHLLAGLGRQHWGQAASFKNKQSRKKFSAFVLGGDVSVPVICFEDAESDLAYIKGGDLRLDVAHNHDHWTGV